MQLRKKALLTLCGLLAAGAALVVMVAGNAVSDRRTEDDVLPGQRVTASAMAHGSQASARATDARDTAFPGVKKDRIGTPLADDPFGPTSKAEQDWLQRNGFPTEDQLHAYSVASSDALREAAQAGDAVAEAFYEGNRLLEGDPAAEARLRDLAARGSTFGLARMAAFFAGSRTHRDVIKAHAYSRAAEMLGDVKGGLTRDMMFSKPLDPMEKLEAEAFAIELYGAIVQRRKQLKGPNAPASDPRPVHVD